MPDSPGDSGATMMPEWLWPFILHQEGAGPETIGRSGEIGRAQIMPSTAAGYGVEREALFDEPTNLALGQRILGDMLRKYHDPVLAAAAYNAGPGRVDQYVHGGKPLPHSTENYIAPLVAGGGQGPKYNAPGQYLPMEPGPDFNAIRQDALKGIGPGSPAPMYNIQMPSPDAGMSDKLASWERMQRLSMLMELVKGGKHEFQPIDYDPWAVAKASRIG